MKRIHIAAFIGALSIAASAHAEKLVDKPEWQYANLLYEGVFTCSTKYDTYQVSVNYGSNKQPGLRDEYMSCIHEFSEKAQSQLPKALKSARNDAVRAKVKDLYSSWDAYFGSFAGPGAGSSKSKYENARAALKTELVAAE